MSHVDGLFAAIADDEVYRVAAPAAPADAARDGPARSAEALRMHQQGLRVPFVQRDARTGEIIGTTSYYAVDEVNRGIAIGYTMLAPRALADRRQHRVEAAAAAARLRRRSARSGSSGTPTCATSARSGRSSGSARVREGVLRRHKLRPDGTWRDTVQLLDDRRRVAERHRPRLREMLRDPVPVG